MASKQFGCFFLVAALNVILSFVVTSTAGQTTLTCSSMGWFAHPTDCTKYYYCDKNLKPTLYSCGSGTHYDPAYEDCEAGPCPSTTTSTTPSTTTSTTTESTTTSTTAEPTTTTTTEEPTTTTTTEEPTTTTTEEPTTTTTEEPTTTTTEEPTTTTTEEPTTTTTEEPTTTTTEEPTTTKSTTTTTITPSTTTTTTTPSTTTTKTTVTTASTPTTTEKPCKKAGQTFADPTSKCNFYRCDVNLNPVKEKCPILTIYDSSTGGCIFGFC